MLVAASKFVGEDNDRQGFDLNTKEQVRPPTRNLVANGNQSSVEGTSPEFCNPVTRTSVVSFIFLKWPILISAAAS
ncbi:MAG: hypothetical protein ABSH01_01745 [Terriglobia bacterium]